MASMTKSKEVGTLSSISCKKTNIYSLFNKQLRRKRSHGKRHYNKRAPQPDVTMSTLVDLVDMTEKPEGVHKINSKLVSVSFPQLSCLQELALEPTNSSAEYRVTATILDIANYRLFRPVRSDVPAEKPKHFMKINFLIKLLMPSTFQHSYDQHQLLTKFQFTVDIKSRQLCHMNTLALLPANYLTLHQTFEI